MCMKNEEGYSGCADLLTIPGYYLEKDIIEIIEGVLGASIDRQGTTSDIINMLDRWHELGWMVPDDSKWDDNPRYHNPIGR